ncbi:MAG: hypothetical protein AAB371_01225 [Patescibacteria group bacterium]
MTEKDTRSYFFKLHDKDIRNTEIAIALARKGAGISITVRGDILRISGETECMGIRINPYLLSLRLVPGNAMSETLVRRAKVIGALKDDAPNEEQIAAAA